MNSRPLHHTLSFLCNSPAIIMCVLICWWESGSGVHGTPAISTSRVTLANAPNRWRFYADRDALFCLHNETTFLREENIVVWRLWEGKMRESVQPMMHTILGIIKHPWHSGVMTSVCGEQEGKQPLFQCDTKRANIIKDFCMKLISLQIMFILFSKRGMVEMRGTIFSAVTLKLLNMF
jgi:hypothetical protein